MYRQTRNRMLPAVMCLAVFSVTGARPQAATDSAPAVLRILNINVWSGLDYRGYLMMGEYDTPEVREQRYRALLAQIRQMDPDIIGLHEANKLPDYADRLEADLGLTAFYHVGLGGVRMGPAGIPWNLREGDVILARGELKPSFAGREQLSGGYVGNTLTFHFSDATQVIAVRVEVRGKPFYVFATHWHASPPASAAVLAQLQRWRQEGRFPEAAYDEALASIREGVAWRMVEAEKTLGFIRRITGDDPFVLMGDLNAGPDAPEIDQLREAGLRDLFEMLNPDRSGYTWDPLTNLNHHRYYSDTAEPVDSTDLIDMLAHWHRRRPQRIDYIFAGPDSLLRAGAIAPISCRVVLNREIGGVHASDHYGVLGEIELR